jgi:two-component system OmpR family response regulator
MTMVTSTEPQSRTGEPGRPARILVVDDEPSLADLLTTALGYEGWDVRSAADGAAALRTAAEFEPDAMRHAGRVVTEQEIRTRAT